MLTSNEFLKKNLYSTWIRGLFGHFAFLQFAKTWQRTPVFGSLASKQLSLFLLHKFTISDYIITLYNLNSFNNALIDDSKKLSRNFGSVTWCWYLTHFPTQISLKFSVWKCNSFQHNNKQLRLLQFSWEWRTITLSWFFLQVTYTGIVSQSHSICGEACPYLACKDIYFCPTSTSYLFHLVRHGLLPF